MKCEIIIDKNCEEKIVIYAREKSDLIDKIKLVLGENTNEIFGFKNDEIVKLEYEDIFYITVVDGKVTAVCEKERYILKERLYAVEEKLPKCFVKINQSCIANIRKTKKFDTSISGTLKIQFKNGDVDYVSRRQLKYVKERLGI